MKVIIWKIGTNEKIREIDCKSDSIRVAERVERGVNINLNHNKYETSINES